MFRKLSIFLLLPLLLHSNPLLAQTPDERIVILPFQADAVYPIAINPGNTSVVEFDRSEVVESVAVGDAENWLIETTASANRLVIKPGENAQPTNMVVLTTKRTYAFTLASFAGVETFVLRFTYLNTLADEEAYRMRGNKSLFPSEMVDNGRTTTIFWPQGAQFPAIFVVDEDKEEVIPKYRPAGNGLIVDGVFDQFVFRSGKRKATATRANSTGGG